MTRKPTYKELEKRVLELEKKVSEQNEINNKFKDNELYLRTLINTIPDLLWLKDLQGTYLFCNSRFELFFGAEEKDIIGKNDNDFIDTHLADVFRYNDNPTIEKGKPHRNEELITFASDGHKEILEIIKTPIYTNNGELIGMLGIGHDITAHRHSQDNYKQLIALHQLILETIPVGLMFIRDHKIEWINRAITSMFQYECSDLIGENALDYFVDMDIYMNYFDTSNPVPNKDKTYTAELEGKKKDGSLFWIRLFAKAVNPDDISEGTIWVIQDITERKNLEARVNQIQRIESIGRLAGGIAHDFNNILGIIMGQAEMAMLETSVDSVIYDNLNEIMEAAERSSELTGQLLAFARNQNITPQHLNCNKTISEVINILQTLVGDTITINWQPASDVWPILIDTSQINQIMNNLCVNARDAIANTGQIIIKTGTRTIDEEYCNSHPECLPGDYTTISVSDTGAGMDKSVVNKIFEPFYTTKDLGRGTGLGLAIVYGIVKQNDGFITVYSEYQKGTTFTIYFPRAFSETDIQSEVDEKNMSSYGNETILLMEDPTALSMTTQKMMEKLGYKVLPVTKPEDALSVAEQHRNTIQLFATDIAIPDMNGRILAKKITHILPEIKTLFMTVHTVNVITHGGFLDKGIHYIQKPFTIQDLSDKIREALSD